MSKFDVCTLQQTTVPFSMGVGCSNGLESLRIKIVWHIIQKHDNQQHKTIHACEHFHFTLPVL